MRNTLCLKLAHFTLDTIKCVLVGDGCVGKTMIIWQFVYNKPFPFYTTTVFDQHTKNLTLNDETYAIVFMDSSGQEDYDRLRPLTYTNADVVLICVAADSPGLFENVEEKWYPEVRQHRPNVPIILVQNKIDLRDDASTIEELKRYRQKPATREEGLKLAEKLHAEEYRETSGKTGEGIQELFEEVVRVYKLHKSKNGKKRRSGIKSLFQR